MPCGTWDVSYLTRDQTCALSIGRSESYPLDLQESLWGDFSYQKKKNIRERLFREYIFLDLFYEIYQW